LISLSGECEVNQHASEESEELSGEDMTAHLQKLLKAAEDRESHEVSADDRRVTRSKGVSLQWNPAMGNKDVVLRK